jgi:hypothetical protein
MGISWNHLKTFREGLPMEVQECISSKGAWYTVMDKSFATSLFCL